MFTTFVLAHLAEVEHSADGSAMIAPPQCFHLFASLFESAPPPRLFLRCRVNFLSHKPGFEDFCVSNFFGMTFVGQSENILVYDYKVP
jgi:hypothetical protein